MSYVGYSKSNEFSRGSRKNEKKYCITTAYLCSSPGPWRPHTSGNAGCLQLDHVSLQSLSQAAALPQQPSDQEALWLSNSDKPYEEQIKVTIKKETKRTRRNVGCYGYIQVIVIADGKSKAARRAGPVYWIAIGCCNKLLILMSFCAAPADGS